MEILRKGEQKVICSQCGTILRYTNADLRTFESGNGIFIECPICENRIIDHIFEMKEVKNDKTIYKLS